ncbi:hypothetical protein FOXG_22881 [Fusarium oxysporum f. sp. lycopersici 4287]|uniref:Uncharacterized protein n=1 Tax=Fusarium oxysporum f. sp. lycopersici (strain 4287 / CBS 123668 / FGSC 9935 / NRRL 34936) TaxID=426428 RepID=A0A0J9WD60_FUSO4|nr:uncharacterized protein FOXG_22881 [Fusarium oxysporum f. sp. lycopersici 4287]KNB20616.1 hypothetical protein FOXG_22881 [Fusarium oxysporum f. sp. lycopersici 4287]
MNFRTLRVHYRLRMMLTVENLSKTPAAPALSESGKSSL